ncbi:hypothetical protein N7E81_04255 [Reichenbachiella carrageenanivorans]|uniref:STAS/SEC14 domain-containing protein n=1 Tax=Reichenbachiella carrageenanivorans TaxID=2979869 RepID=A0ABY6D2C5_9BACT|nr:hypothetical protein [Reichenbachiella carrageenanivorans]UXX80311.1 hypothetical protein N7E81_04255 [Reichenbachiella carrageenanivorans]
MTTFYKKEGVVTASSNAAAGTMTVQWDSLLDDQAIEECCQAQIEQVKKGIKILFLDVSVANGVPSQKRQEWFENYLFPNFSALGLKASITILPKSALTKLASKKWVKNSGAFNFDVFEAASLNDAQELARQL